MADIIIKAFVEPIIAVIEATLEGIIGAITGIFD